MAKAISYWYGNDSVGRPVEVAQREDGVYFARSYEWNGYGKNWTKWKEHEASFVTTTENAYSGEVTEHPERPIMCWGFMRLTQCSDVPRFRLPNKE